MTSSFLKNRYRDYYLSNVTYLKYLIVDKVASCFKVELTPSLNMPHIYICLITWPHKYICPIPHAGTVVPVYIKTCFFPNQINFHAGV